MISPLTTRAQKTVVEMNIWRSLGTKMPMPFGPLLTKPRTLTVLLWLAIAGFAGVTSLSFLSRLHWTLELFTHFPMQMTAGLSVVLAAALLLRRWSAVAATLLCLLPHVIAISYYHPSRDFPPGTPALRTVSFNVLTLNDSHDEILAFLQQSEADILFVMETNDRWVQALSPLEAKYPYSIKAPRSDNFGMLLFSRHPIESYQLHEVDGSRVPLVHATIDLDGKFLDLIGGHPVPPVGGRQAEARNDYLQGLTNLILKTKNPTIVFGDFNATVWSPHLRKLLKETKLQDTGRKRGFQSTWRRFNPFFSIPIDHVFHNDGLICLKREIGPALGSDHSPVIAEFALAE